MLFFNQTTDIEKKIDTFSMWNLAIEYEVGASTATERDATNPTPRVVSDAAPIGRVRGSCWRARPEVRPGDAVPQFDQEG
jgi:hypothetical protein